MEWRVTCSNCQQPIDNPGGIHTCSNCGSSARTIHALLKETVTVDTAGVTIDYSAPRTWWEQWLRIRQSLDRVRRLYSGSGVSGELKGEVESFAEACWHLWDWLLNDDALSPQVTKRMLRQHLAISPSLQIVNGLANTTKHFSRRKPADMTARVVRLVSDESGSSAIVGFWSGGQPQQNIDALDLAEQAVDCGDHS